MVLQFIFTVLAVSEHSLEIHKTVVSSNRGAMVLSDLEHCCIGEFDKMSAEHQVFPDHLPIFYFDHIDLGLILGLPFNHRLF